MALSSPLTPLNPSIDNSKQRQRTGIAAVTALQQENLVSEHTLDKMASNPVHDASDDDFHDSFSNAATSPSKNSLHTQSIHGSPESANHRSPWRSSQYESQQTPRSNPLDALQHLDRSPTNGSGGASRNTLEDSMVHGKDEGMSTIMHGRPGSNEQAQGEDTEITLNMEDTVGDISTFSVIPEADLTRFAALRGGPESPTRRTGAADWSPSKQLRSAATPTVKRPLQLAGRSISGGSPDSDATPRQSISNGEDLLNFTGQSNVFIPPHSQQRPRPAMGRTPSGRGGFPIRVNPSPSHRSQASVDRERSRGGTSPVKATVSTPQADRRTNLLDFDLDPVPTPRSIPTVTPRELESLRSDLSSQISSLSATLSGKEAEVQALKRAVTDAEVRVGNTSEELRHEKSLRESLEHDQSEWDRQRREMETVLREIRQEIMVGEHQRDKLRRQAEEAEKKTEDMEVRVVELQTRLESANRRASLSPTASPRKNSSNEPATPLTNGVSGMDINEAVREATERVARDLHALYKSKHETKVAALKKSYEARWEKKVRHLEDELKAATTEIVNLKTERDATMSGPVHLSLEAQATADKERSQQRQLLDNQTRISEQLARETESLKTENKTLDAKIVGLNTQLASVNDQTATLRQQLEQERVEKGELVAQVDLFLAMGDEPPRLQSQHRPTHSNTSTGASPARSGPESRTRSVSEDSITTASTASSTTKEQPPGGSPVRPGAGARAGRPRPMSMLQQPGKYFSGIPGPGGRGKPGAGGLGTGVGGRGGILEGIAKMGAGGRGY